MTDIMSILSAGNANIKQEITGEDLRNFSEELISRAVNEVATAMQDNKEDCLLTKEETKKRLGVCDATLWHWDKKGYLKPVKVGSGYELDSEIIAKVFNFKTLAIFYPLVFPTFSPHMQGFVQSEPRFPHLKSSNYG